MRTIVVILAIVAAAAGVARADRPERLTVAIHAPSLAFGSAGERLELAERVAKAIQAKTGITTVARAYARYGDLLASKPDLAIVDGLCIAARAPGPVLATVVVDGATSREWGVFARAATTIPSLQGKRLAFAQTGCRDGDFVDNVVLGGEVKSARFFSKAVTKADVLGAVASVKDYTEADAVIAPRAQAGSLAMVLTVGALPNPGLVQLARGVDADLVADIGGTVKGLAGWAGPVAYTSLAGRLGAARRSMIAATPEPERLDLQQMASPARGGYATTPIRTMLWKPTPAPKR